jgi:hypothetical protein
LFSEGEPTEKPEAIASGFSVGFFLRTWTGSPSWFATFFVFACKMLASSEQEKLAI